MKRRRGQEASSTDASEPASFISVPRDPAPSDRKPQRKHFEKSGLQGKFGGQLREGGKPREGAKNQAGGPPKSVGKIKREIRNLKRLAKVEGLPPTVVQDNERKLEVLESKLIDTQAGKVSEKYKMVRFFEKRKLYRKLKKARTAHTDEDEQVQKIRDLINYVVYFPLGEKYMSVLPKEPYTDTKVLERQQEIMGSITGKVVSKELEDASVTEWCKDKNISRTKIKSLQAEDLSVSDRKVHSKPNPEPSSTDDFFLIDRG